MLKDFANCVSISVFVSSLKALSDVIPHEVDQNIFVLGGVDVTTQQLPHKIQDSSGSPKQIPLSMK